MNGEIVKKASRFLRRRKKWLILLASFGVSSYGAYRIYHLPSIARKRKRLMKLFGATFSVAELVLDSTETLGIISRDLNVFLKSDSDEIPNSLKQISKIAASEDFTQSVARVSEALTIGVFRGYNSESRIESSSGTGATDKVVDRLFSESGSGFVSIVVGSFAKNLVLGFYSNEQENGRYSSSSSDTPRWLNLLCNNIQCKELLGDCIQKFVSIAVGVYLDRTMNINTYDEIFAGLTNPKHQDSVKDILVSVCNGALETLIRTSYNVTTTSKHNDAAAGFENSVEKNVLSKQVNDKILVERIPVDDSENNGWVRVLSKTFTVPSNRKFVFDVTSRVTLETMRSLVEFLWWKLLEGFRQSLHAVQDEAVIRGSQVITYVGIKSSVIVTVCLALYLHVLTSTRVLLPAS